MNRFWATHWQFRYWRSDVNREGEPIRGSGGNRYLSRGIRGGDGHKAFIVSLHDGQLYVGGRMTVSRIVSRDQACRVLRNDQLYGAREWLIDDTPEGGTRLHLQRRLAPEVSRQIVCIMAGGGERGLFFVDDANLDVQATRGVRELTRGSAALLDRIIALTDAMPDTGDILTVTPEMLGTPNQPNGQQRA